ncbi:unnamed protein product [Withania somnifera]
MKDMVAFLNCLILNHNKDDKSSGNKRKPWGSTNYHLQRLNRGRR